MKMLSKAVCEAVCSVNWF